MKWLDTYFVQLSQSSYFKFKCKLNDNCFLSLLKHKKCLFSRAYSFNYIKLNRFYFPPHAHISLIV